MTFSPRRRRLLALLPALAVGACGPRATTQSSGRRLTAPALERLKSRFTGRLLLPTDAAFEAARRPASFNADTDKHPALIANCASVDDVRRSIEFARRHALEIAVRGGGHDVLGRCTTDGGVLIDLGLMNAIEVNGQAATVQAGCRAGQVNAVLQDHGLAVALGCNPAVGVGGLTLGGGLGWLLGTQGAACDNLNAVELVTADGDVLRLNERQNADLFWGVRGGGGNFGIATAFDYRARRLGRVSGGYIVYEGARAIQLLQLYREQMAQAPDGLTVECVMFASPQPPHRPIVIAALCHSGEPGRVERDLAAWKRLGPPLADAVSVVDYANVADPPDELAQLLGIAPSERADSRPSEDGGGHNYWRGASLSDWSDTALHALVACMEAAPPGWSIGLGHYMHGAVCRVPADATPLIRRAGTASYFFNIGWGDAEQSEAAERWVNQSMAALRPHSNEPAYINYLSEESPAAVELAYGAHYSRMRKLKRRYDPENVFHLNRNVMPAV